MKGKNIAVIRLLAGDVKDGKEPAVLARYYSDNGAEEILVFDLSDSAVDHDLSVSAVKEICKASEVPVKAGGFIRKLEDVKKYLYAGCSKVILNYARQDNIDLTKEAAARFGKDRIAASVDSSDVVSAPADLVEDCVSELIYLHEIKPFQEQLRPLSCNMEWDEFKLGPDGLVPVVVQDYQTDEVLMVAYMNRDAFEKTLETGKMTYFSRSRQELWVKGMTSGHFQYVKELRVDCDCDTILAKVSQTGAACHTGSRTCFFHEIAKTEYRVLAGDVKDGKEPAVLARYYSDNGAEEILVFDLSDSAVDHDLSVSAVKEICKASEVPVKAGGFIRKLEDVKK